MKGRRRESGTGRGWTERKRRRQQWTREKTGERDNSIFFVGGIDVSAVW